MNDWPQRWGARRARFAFARRDVRGVQAPLASATIDGVVLRKDLDFSVWNPESDISNYKLVEPGDFVIGLRSFQHGISHSTVRGLVSPAYTVLRAADGIEPRFFRHYFRSRVLISRLANMTQGIRQGQAIDIEAFANLALPVPPLEEQRRIADFLDAETARIDRISALRVRHRESLESRFRQVLDATVLGRLGALVGLSSTIDASTWRRRKVSREFEIVPGYSFPSDNFTEADSGVRLLRGINVAVGRIDWSETVGWDIGTYPIPRRFHLRAGDLVIGMDRPWISGGLRIAFLEESDLPALLVQRVACVRPKGRARVEYVRWVLSSSHFRDSVEAELTGVSVPHLSGEQIGNFEFLLPDPDSQSMVSMSLQRQYEDVLTATGCTGRQLTLLAERRQALITAAVTGQIDVDTARAVVS